MINRTTMMGVFLGVILAFTQYVHLKILDKKYALPILIFEILITAISMIWTIVHEQRVKHKVLLHGQKIKMALGIGHNSAIPIFIFLYLMVGGDLIQTFSQSEWMDFAFLLSSGLIGIAIYLIFTSILAFFVGSILNLIFRPTDLNI